MHKVTEAFQCIRGHPERDWGSTVDNSTFIIFSKRVKQHLYEKTPGRPVCSTALGTLALEKHLLIPNVLHRREATAFPHVCHWLVANHKVKLESNLDRNLDEQSVKEHIKNQHLKSVFKTMHRVVYCYQQANTPHHETH